MSKLPTGTSLEDRRPTPIIDEPPYLKRGFMMRMWLRFQAKPMKQKIGTVALPIAFLLFLSVGRRVMNPVVIDTPAYESEVSRRVDYETVNAPLNFLDITAGEYQQLSPQSQVDYLLGHLPAIERRMLGSVNDNHVALLSIEADRMRAEAIKEAQSKEGVNVNDSSGTLDLVACLKNMQPYQCVLLRYAGEALESLYLATAGGGDVYQMNAALVRYQAALYALNELRPHQVDSGPMLTLLTNYRALMSTVIARSPASQRPAVSNQGSGAKGVSPISTFIKQQGYISEQNPESPVNSTAPVENPVVEKMN